MYVIGQGASFFLLRFICILDRESIFYILITHTLWMTNAFFTHQVPASEADPCAKLSFTTFTVIPGLYSRYWFVNVFVIYEKNRDKIKRLF